MRQVHTRAVEAVVGRLLMAACADTSVSVRRTVLKSVQAPSSLDTYLAQAAWCALALLPQCPEYCNAAPFQTWVAVGEHDLSIHAPSVPIAACARCSWRGLAGGVVGRLAGLNPAYIMPAARKHLMQLLNDMEHSPDSKQREGARVFLEV